MQFTTNSPQLFLHLLFILNFLIRLLLLTDFLQIVDSLISNFCNLIEIGFSGIIPVSIFPAPMTAKKLLNCCCAIVEETSVLLPLYSQPLQLKFSASRPPTSISLNHARCIP